MSRDKRTSYSTKSTRPGRPAISDEARREMRKKIASSTRQLFEEHGYSQISMRRIAQEVGCSAMTLYKYYDAKIDILHTLWSDVFKAVFDKLDALPFDQESSREQLTLLTAAYVDYWLDNPEHYRMVFMTEGVKQPDVSVFLEDPHVMLQQNLFANAIAQASATTLTKTVLSQKLGALICFANGIAHNLITISGQDWPATDYLVGSAINGVIGDVGE